MAGPGAQVLPTQLVMIDEFLMDVSLNETHEFESEVTEYPVESGSNISDNVRPKPITVSMECLVSNNPIGFLADSRGPGSGSPSDPVDDAYQHLQKIRDAREPVTIRTSLRTFDNMVLKGLSIPRSQGRGDELRFTANFQQIQVIENKRTRIRTSSPTGQKKKKYGLTLDKLIEGAKILWRVGLPPGRSPATDPPGLIIGEEVVIVYPKVGPFEFSFAVGAQICHQPKTPGGQPIPLDTKELQDFQKDMDRDNSLSTRRELKRIDDRLKANDDRIARALKLANEPVQNPAAKVDPAMFKF